MEIEKIKKTLSGIEMIENADMAALTSFKAGGKAACLCVVKSVEELKKVISFSCDEKIKYFILGNGTNVLFRDGIFDGIVVKMDPQSDAFGFMRAENECGSATADKITFSVGASALLSAFSKFTALGDAPAKGMEALSGIPGSVGGAVFMNAGAYGTEIKDVLKSVHAVSPDGNQEKDFLRGELELGYRHSLLMENGYIVTSAVFELEPGDAEESKALMDEYRIKRNTKQPVQFPSAGSTFKRPEGYFAGKLIEDSNLKGLSVGGAAVSTLHAGFIINENNATAADILNLITLVKNTVYDKFGVELEPEVRII